MKTMNLITPFLYHSVFFPSLLYHWQLSFTDHHHQTATPVKCSEWSNTPPNFYSCTSPFTNYNTSVHDNYKTKKNPFLNNNNNLNRQFFDSIIVSISKGNFVFSNFKCFLLKLKNFIYDLSLGLWFCVKVEFSVLKMLKVMVFMFRVSWVLDRVVITRMEVEDKEVLKKNKKLYTTGIEPTTTASFNDNMANCTTHSWRYKFCFLG